MRADSTRQARLLPASMWHGGTAIKWRVCGLAGVAGLVALIWAVPTDALAWALGGSALGFLSTALGAMLVLLPGRYNQRFLELSLGLSGGMMLAAAVFSLLLPAIDTATEIFPPFYAHLAVILATLGGAWMMCEIERHVPHGHPVAGDTGPGHRHLSRLWLFVLAIALHNLPEGIAVGVSFSGADWHSGSSVSLAIALQDFPEGFAMAVVLLRLGLGVWKAVGWSLLAGLLEPLGAVIGVFLGGIAVFAYPLSLALSAGAMLFVVIHEVIPEVQSPRTSRLSVQGTMTMLGGFLLLWFLDSQAFVRLLS
ncbi:ZIP family metal transporter [Bowmanella sp. Y26]|uniref:ZIP family metal transporter n=1 Tax=Bowmanella yangjiangensis TaxID=2811230 RepID=UPI001BDC3C1C|nr:ZIP family metal transporter [Bowmanella yangjiangensis]MBT1065441.1 ZIP family metal transporter [Bowmanella yangjiangensis]